MEGGGGRQVVPGVAEGILATQPGSRWKSSPQPACRLSREATGVKKLEETNGDKNQSRSEGMEQGGRLETWISVQLLQQVRLRGFKTETWWEGAQVLFLTGEDCVVGGMGTYRTAQLKQRKTSVQSSSPLVPGGGTRIDTENILPNHTFNH